MAGKNSYDVILEKVGNQQLKTTKALCSALGLGLAAAKGMVDKAPTTVAKGLDKEKALALKKELEALGNTVSIPGMETKTEAPATKKTTTTKKQTTKKSAPSSSKAATPKNDDFDAIFGGDATQKETKPQAKIERVELKNGDVYEGEYKDGKYHGQGKYTSSKGWVYEGQFTDGQITGKGKITYATGAVYEGELLKGNKNGFGRITYTDGLYYEGEWKDDKKHGKSTYTQKLGSYTLLYTGMWNMSKRTGPHDYYSITNPEKKVYRQFYENDEAVGSEFCPVGIYANWTMADAVANKKRVEAEHRQYWEDQKARGAAQSRTSSTSHRSADSSDVDKAKKNGTVFTEWASIDPSMFNEALAVSHEGCLVDMNSEILKQEQEQGYYYMKYHTARDGKKVTLYLFFYDEVIQEDYVCTDASMNHTELVKRKIYLCLPRGAGFSKKEIYVDGDGNQIGNGYLFATDVAPGINELADCISLPDEKWEFAGTLSPDGQFKVY